MANLTTLKTNHYRSNLIPTKTIKIDGKTFIGFKLNELIDYKLYKYEYSFTHKGLTYINKKLVEKLYFQYKLNTKQQR